MLLLFQVRDVGEGSGVASNGRDTSTLTESELQSKMQMLDNYVANGGKLSKAHTKDPTLLTYMMLNAAAVGYGPLSSSLA